MIEIDTMTMMIKDTMEPIQDDKELVAILQYVSTENGWGRVLRSTVVDSPRVEQDENTIYTMFHFECELENSLIDEVKLTAKGYLNNGMYWIEEIIIEE